MQATLEAYRERIQSGQVNPLVRWDGQTSRTLFDPADDATPLTTLGFGAYRLDDGPHRLDTGDCEYIFVPVDGMFEITIGSKSFKGDRTGGPFTALPGPSNAFAVYAPRDATAKLSGRGEVVWFSAPTNGEKPPTMVTSADRENIRRGTGTWHRDVITMFAPDDVTTHLVGGETYSPPALWSGTPLHVHDLDDPAGSQSDHEEVYYHLARHTEGAWGPFGVQMLFDGTGLDQAYMIHNRDAFAIPGAAHPVVSGPASDMLYVWALAGAGGELQMVDVPEFAYLKGVGDIIDRAEAARPRESLVAREFNAWADKAKLNEAERVIARLHLRERGIAVQ